MEDRRKQSVPVDDERRRRQRRRNLRCTIGIWVEEIHGDAKYFHYSSNISYSGIFLEKRLPLPLKTEVSLELAHPSTDERLVVQGLVVNWREYNADIAGMGIEFVFPSEDLRAQFHAFVDSVKAHWKESAA